MRKLLIATTLLAAGLTATAQTTTEDLDAKYGTELLKPGTPAPDFTLRSLWENDTVGYNFKRNSEGAYFVLDFWASWCGDCRRDMPAVAAMSRKYFDKGVNFVGISYDTDSVAWRKCATEQYKLVGAQLSELKKWKETQTSKDYHITWLPTMYLINPDGTVNLATVDHKKMERRLAELDAAGEFEKYKLRMPQYPGGVNELVKFLSRHVKYPKTCEKAGAQATVYVEFVVNKEGALENIRVRSYRQLGKFSPRKAVTSTAQLTELEQQCRRLFEAEALRVVGLMSRWEPGTRGDKPVRVRYVCPITFRF